MRIELFVIIGSCLDHQPSQTHRMLEHQRPLKSKINNPQFSARETEVPRKAVTCPGDPASLCRSQSYNPGLWPPNFRVLLTDPVGWEEKLQGDTEGKA